MAPCVGGEAIVSIVTVDADGQHLAEDVARIYSEIRQWRRNQRSRMRVWNSRSLLQANAAATMAASGDSANPGTLSGKPSETSMPRDDSIWRTILARPSASPSARLNRPGFPGAVHYLGVAYRKYEPP